MKSLITTSIDQHLELINKLYSLESPIAAAIDIAITCLSNGGKLMFCGNGGSAADSQHLASEFTGRFVKDRRPLAAMALSTDSSALTCISNDYAFSEVFSRQIIGLGKAGDCLFGISTSGNSENIFHAVKVANELNINTIGLLGRDGGKLAPLCHCSIIVPSDITARIQETHILIGHIICDATERGLGFI